MKKITFILFTLFAGTAFGQDASRANATAEVSAEIISPISITGGDILNFGRIIGASEGGNVRIDEAGTRTFSNPNLSAPSTGEHLPKAALFAITAALGYNYNIYIPGINLTGDGDDMAVTFTHNLEASGNVGSGSSQDLNVGGLLTVNPNQQEGDYSGTVTVTVAYE